MLGSCPAPAADIAVRMRACPFGTTGKEESGHEYATLVERLSQILGLLRLAQHHRNDRRLAGRDSESCLLDALAESPRMVF